MNTKKRPTNADHKLLDILEASDIPLSWVSDQLEIPPPTLRYQVNKDSVPIVTRIKILRLVVKRNIDVALSLKSVIEKIESEIKEIEGTNG